MFCKPSYEKTSWELWVDFIKEKQTNPELRFGQYFLNTVYPQLSNADIYYNTNDVKTSQYVIEKYCDSNGKFQDIQ